MASVNGGRINEGSLFVELFSPRTSSEKETNQWGNFCNYDSRCSILVGHLCSADHLKATQSKKLNSSTNAHPCLQWTSDLVKSRQVRPNSAKKESLDAISMGKHRQRFLVVIFESESCQSWKWGRKSLTLFLGCNSQRLPCWWIWCRGR